MVILRQKVFNYILFLVRPELSLLGTSIFTKMQALLTSSPTEWLGGWHQGLGMMHASSRPPKKTPHCELWIWLIRIHSWTGHSLLGWHNDHRRLNGHEASPTNKPNSSNAMSQPFKCLRLHSTCLLPIPCGDFPFWGPITWLWNFHRLLGQVGLPVLSLD
jgi:hypothetical protein